jgi:hypothetical protein
MSLYFSISDLLDELERAEPGLERFSMLAGASVTPPDCAGHPEDAFILTNLPKILDLRAVDAPHKLVMLIEDVPLYQINIELALDRALSERHRRPVVERALNIAFKNEPLPGSMPMPQAAGDFTSTLRHAMLGHLNNIELCETYISFLNAMSEPPLEYRFEKSVIGKHQNRFKDYYSGFLTAHGGQVVAEILLAFGYRRDHDPAKGMESYIETGEKTARKMRVNEPMEMLWAWLEADDYQRRRCHDLDRLLKLGKMKRIPNWVKTDLFCFLEKEAMKQVFAESFVKTPDKAKLLEKAPKIRQAIEANAGGAVDENLQHLLAQILNPDSPYAGAAERFDQAARLRAHEALQAGIGG